MPPARRWRPTDLRPAEEHSTWRWVLPRPPGRNSRRQQHGDARRQAISSPAHSAICHKEVLYRQLLGTPYYFQANYQGGDGNDLVLTSVSGAPVVQLNSPNVNYASTWIGTAVSLASSTATITDAESGNLISLTATLTTPGGPRAGDVLAANTSGTSISSSYSSGMGTLTLSGSDTLRALPAGVTVGNVQQHRGRPRYRRGNRQRRGQRRNSAASPS